ncbi:MAG: alpha/beta hydrolase [Gammaproteobacteria bacterium]|nr:alpha/beta hydrolase [Gammaproteobacteria bacterium]
MDRIIVREDAVIGRAGARDLTGNLFIPPMGTVPRPAMVIVHGGGWARGSPRGVRGFGEYLSQLGFVCLCPSYRLSGEAHWPAQIEDVKCAIRYLKANCDALGVDPARVGVTGDSAGGHLALMAAATSDFEGASGHAGCSSEVKAVGSMYGPTRARRNNASGKPTGLLLPEANDRDYGGASPICYDLANFPPCLLIHGSEDPAVPLADTIDLYTKLSGLGRAVELHVFAGEGHAFDRRSTTRDGMVDVADPSSVYGQTVLRLIEHFFSKYLEGRGG